MNETITCTCGRNNWQWQIDELSRSWIRCRNCDDSMFGSDIGVILINWKVTDLPPDWTIEDVLVANQGNGVVQETKVVTPQEPTDPPRPIGGIKEWA